MSGPGHNGGPSLEPGQGWRRHCWARARADLLPQLPLNVIRRRVARAKDLGLDYRTYATVRATTGRDIVAFLFSSNALRMHLQARIPEDRAGKLNRIADCGRVAALLPPLAALPAGMPLDHGFVAPTLADSPRDERARILEGLRAGPYPSDAVLVVGSTALERGWSVNARLAGYIEDARYFCPPG